MFGIQFDIPVDGMLKPALSLTKDSTDKLGQELSIILANVHEDLSDMHRMIIQSRFTLAVESAIKELDNMIKANATDRLPQAKFDEFKKNIDTMMMIPSSAQLKSVNPRMPVIVAYKKGEVYTGLKKLTPDYVYIKNEEDTDGATAEFGPSHPEFIVGEENLKRIAREGVCIVFESDASTYNHHTPFRGHVQAPLDQAIRIISQRYEDIMTPPEILLKECTKTKSHEMKNVVSAVECLKDSASVSAFKQLEREIAKHATDIPLISKCMKYIDHVKKNAPSSFVFNKNDMEMYTDLQPQETFNWIQKKNTHSTLSPTAVVLSPVDDTPMASIGNIRTDVTVG
jgi:hypothetical protein